MIDLLAFENTLVETLDALLDRAFRTQSVATLEADVDQAVKRRTARGEFLEGSAPDAGRYRSSGWKKAREEKGLQIDRVDLFFDGAMLDGTRSRAEVVAGADSGTELAFEYGYLEGLSEDEAVRKAGYHNDPETARVVRRFVGLRDDEQAGAVERWAAELGETIRREAEG